MCDDFSSAAHVSRFRDVFCSQMNVFAVGFELYCKRPYKKISFDQIKTFSVNVALVLAYMTQSPV